MWRESKALTRRALAPVERRLIKETGGRRQANAVLLFAAVLALDSADRATVGSSAVPLRDALHISDTQIGLLVTVSSLVGAAGTLVFGIFVDRFDRSRLLGIAVLTWAVAMVAGALSTSFLYLLLSRVFLGVVGAAAGPAIASMTGDLFPPATRSRIYGLVLSGELVGAGIGFAVTGTLAAVSWRASFLVLALPALALGPLLWRMTEPERGAAYGRRTKAAESSDDPQIDAALTEAIENEDVEAQDEHVLREDPNQMSLPRVIRYVLSIRTNVLLVVASVCGYYFFSGLSTFGVSFVREHYGAGQAAASSITLILGLGAIAGVLTSGPLADRLLARGRSAARVEVTTVALAFAVVLFVPALLANSLLVALPILTAAMFMLGALNPPLDAARLDIMPPPLWGRAEGVRSLLRGGAQAVGPLAFGAMSDGVFGGGGTGLQHTFLVMLVPVVGAVGIGFAARGSYRRDVATAAASARSVKELTTQGRRRRRRPDAPTYPHRKASSTAGAAG